jgi:hypothetical protein
MIRVRGFLTTTELAPYVQRVKCLAFELDDEGIERELANVATGRATRAVNEYVDHTRDTLMKLAAENKRLREQLGRKKKRTPAKVADVISLAAVKAASS